MTDNKQIFPGATLEEFVQKLDQPVGNALGHSIVVADDDGRSTNICFFR